MKPIHDTKEPKNKRASPYPNILDFIKSGMNLTYMKSRFAQKVQTKDKKNL